MSAQIRTDKAVFVRMPAALAAVLDATAKARGMSTAALVRLVAAEAVGVADQFGKRRSPPRPRRPVVVESETDLRMLVRRLGQVIADVATMPESTSQAETLALLREAARQAIGAVQSCR